MENTRPAVSAHPGVCEMHCAMQSDGISNVFDRFDLQQPQCAFGKMGICCQLCSHGPCRISRRTDRGICGADGNTIAARNLIRLASHGTGAYSHHLRTALKTLRTAAEGGFPGLNDGEKLNAVAESLGLATDGGPAETARALADLFDLELVRSSDEPNAIVERWAPAGRLEVWRNLGIMPGGPHSELADAMAKSMTSIDTDPVDLLLSTMRMAIATGYVEMMGVESIQDVLFGRPRIGKTRTGLGVIDPAYVNIVAHGHEPFMGEAVLEAAMEPDLQAMAREAGAEGIRLYGSMDTGQEILQRKADHPAFGGQIGNWLSQEFMVYTGAVDLVMMDMNCSIPGIKIAADARHTRLVPVSKIVRMAGVSDPVDFDPQIAREQARKLVRMAIDSYKRRDQKVIHVPAQDQSEAMVGFGIEAIVDALGGSPDPLLNAIKSGAIKGIAAVVGCTNNANGQDHVSVALTRELIRRDILVINSGCVSSGVQNRGLMRPEAAAEAGEGLRAVCEALGIPPALNFGTCTDIGRIVQAVNAIAGALGVDPAQLPVAASAPEYLEQKAVVDGFFGVASGLLVHLSPAPPVGGAAQVAAILTEDVEALTGGKLLVEPNPVLAADGIERHILSKREGLGI
jgi:carbon-monoxide dehydrogenase catalytic subunit